MDGIYAPFAARVSPEQAARFYAETLFTPEGSLDPAVWQKEYARLGPQGLATAINGGAAYRGAARAAGAAAGVPVPAGGHPQTLPNPAADRPTPGAGASRGGVHARRAGMVRATRATHGRRRPG